jgi:dihydrofolate synthase/folylpolyglutamate synthase
MIDAAVGSAGYRTGRYTSPHLVDLSERFTVNQRPVSEETLTAVLSDVRRLIDNQLQSGALAAMPTFFEVTTAAALEIFRRAAVDVAVCEVGLGGRQDATNVLSPLVSAITSIGLDHQEHLGTTLREIAGEKAGIIKPGTPIVHGRMGEEAVSVIAAAAMERGAKLIEAWDGVVVQPLADRRDQASGWAAAFGPSQFSLRTPLRNYGPVRLGLAGAHQIDNAVVAVRVLELLPNRGIHVTLPAILDGLASVKWPGRLERRELADGREIVFDAAHNPDGARALAASLSRISPNERPPLVFAAMRDKDAAGMIEALAPFLQAVVVTKASNPRAMDPSELARLVHAAAPRVSVAVERSPREALSAAWRMSPRIVVAGSIFLLGDVMEELDRS